MISKSIKIVVLTLIICIFAFGLAALAQQKTETLTAGVPLPQPRVVKVPHIAYLCSSMSMESMQREWNQAQIEVEHRGWKMTSITDVPTPAEQRDALENVVNQNVDAIVIVAFFMEPIKDVIMKAREKGIGVYIIDNELRPGVIVSPTQLNGVVGARLTYYGVERMKEVGKVLIISFAEHILRQRTYAAKGLLENDWPNVELVGYEDVPSPGWEKASFDLTQNYISRYGEELKWIISGWDTPGIFAARAVEEAGLTRDDIFITGIDGGAQAYAEIRKGSPFTATMSQPIEQYCHTAFEVINQVQVEGIGIGEKGSMVPPGRFIYCDAVLTTPENLPEVGSNIHELFGGEGYYDPSDEDAWYTWGEPYRVE